MTELEAKHSIFREMRVGGNESSHTILLSSGIDWDVVTIAVLVEDVGVSVREGTTLHILTGDTHVVTLVNER